MSFDLDPIYVIYLFVAVSAGLFAEQSLQVPTTPQEPWTGVLDDLASELTIEDAAISQAADSPLAKIFYSEVNLAMTEFGVALQGVDGLAVEGDPQAYADGWWQDAFLYARAYTIAGGANEVLKTVVAERALGLPRDKR